MSIINESNCTLTWDFKHPLEGDEFNSNLLGLIKPGIYSGGELSYVGNVVTIQPFIAYIKYSATKGIRIESTTAISRTVTTVNPMLYVSFTWLDVIENWPDFGICNSGTLGTYALSFGEATFSGPNVNGFSYANKSTGLINANGDVLTDVINEATEGSGVTIEGSLLKDNNFDSAGTITIDTINEHTTDAGVTIEGAILKNTKLAIGISEVKGSAGVVHIANGTNADTNWYDACPLVIERNDTCWINIRTPNDTTGGILWSNPDSEYRGILRYDHTTDVMDFAIAASTMIRLSTNGLYIGGTANPSNTLHVQSTTTPQFRIAYDGSNYVTFTINSVGGLAIKNTANGRINLNPGASDPYVCLAVTGVQSYLRIYDSGSSNYIRFSHDGSHGVFAGIGGSIGVKCSNTTESTSKDTGALIVEGGVGVEKNLSIGGDLQDASGNPVAGWLSDGTPYYIKEISITINSGNLTGTTAHGIANAYTNDKIFNVSWRVDYLGTSYAYVNDSTVDYGIDQVLWTDTNLSISRKVNTNTRIFLVKIWYI